MKVPARSCVCLFLGALLLTGCASLPATKFADSRPAFEPDKFFTGHVRSWGVLENRDGQPTGRILTESWGTPEKGGGVKIEQDLVFESGKKNHRTWHLRRLDATHYEATATDFVGTVRGEAHGNAFTWSFTAIVDPANPLARVQMTQWMYLQPDGRTMINRDSIRKAGVILAYATEEFRKESR